MVCIPAMAFVCAPLVAPAPSAARALRCGWTGGRVAHVAARRRRAVVDDAHPPRPASPPIVMSIVITVGDVVVLRSKSTSSSAKPSLALVTGVASSGTTADIEPLDEFVRSLYVRSGDATYIAVKEMRPVKADYVDAQDGWIVLPEDVESVASSFQAVPLDESVESSGEPEVKVVAAAAKEVPEELQGGPTPFPMPTKSQALRGAGVAAVVGLVLYLGYANVQSTFASSPLVFDEGTQGANVATSYVKLVVFGWGGAVTRVNGDGCDYGGGLCGSLGVFGRTVKDPAQLPVAFPLLGRSILSGCSNRVGLAVAMREEVSRRLALRQWHSGGGFPWNGMRYAYLFSGRSCVLLAHLCFLSEMILASMPQLPVYCAVIGGRLICSRFPYCGWSCGLGGIG